MYSNFLMEKHCLEENNVISYNRCPKNLPTSHVMNMVTVADGIYQMNLDLSLIAVISHTLGFPYTINMSATSEP